METNKAFWAGWSEAILNFETEMLINPLISLLWNTCSDFSCTTEWKSGLVWNFESCVPCNQLAKKYRVLLIGDSIIANFS